MALVIPTARSTYADATSVPGDQLRTYILAQLPDDVKLTWVSEVRSLMTVDELKWKIFRERREHLQAKKQLWKRIIDSWKSATIVVIKPQTVGAEIRNSWEAEGAQAGVDFDQDALIDACATAIIRDTPVAYLPNRLSETLNLYPQNLYLEFEKFAPQQIKDRIGGSLRDAKVFAARAHATFDLSDVCGSNRSTVDTFRNPGAWLVLRELLSTQRGFDEEHPKSIAVLNEAADTMASALSDALMLPGELTTQPLVREFNSRDIDVLQAADIAAGWAHELVALGNENGLGGVFGRVIVNGLTLQ